MYVGWKKKDVEKLFFPIRFKKERKYNTKRYIYIRKAKKTLDFLIIFVYYNSRL